MTLAASMYDSKTSANIEYTTRLHARHRTGIVKGRQSDFSDTYIDSFATIVKVYSEQTILGKKRII
jgi:hypothetical protein